MKKKIFTLLSLCMSALAFAQDYNVVRVVAEEEVYCGSPIIVNGYYSPVEETDPPAVQHQWTLTPVDIEGIPIGDPVHSGMLADGPGEFHFPESELLTCEQLYRIDLDVEDQNGVLHNASSTVSVSANSYPCIAGAPFVYNIPPASGTTIQGHILYLPSAPYYYTVTETGDDIIQNFSTHFNGTAFGPNFMFPMATNTNITFTFNTKWNAGWCKTRHFTYKFYNSANVLACQFTITISTNDWSKQTIAWNPGGPQMGVYYKGDDSKLHRYHFTWNNGWNYQALNPWGGWGNIQVEGWLSYDQPTEKVFFKGKDGKVYNYLVNQGLVGAISSQTNVKSDLQYRNNECVYIGTDNKIHRVYWANNTWNYEAIQPSNGWGSVIAAGGLTLVPTWGSQNVFFRDQNNIIRNLFRMGGSWYLMAVSVPGIGNMICDGQLIFDESQARIYFRRNATTMQNVTYNSNTGQWMFDPMTSANGTVTIYNTMSKNMGEDRVFFKGPGNKVYIYWKQSNGQWRVDWLNGSYNLAFADVVAAGNNIFHVDKNKRIANYWFNNQPSWPANALSYSAPANAIGCSIYYRFGELEDETESGLNELTEEAGMKVYPNPTSGNFTIAFDRGVENAEGRLFNLLGQQVGQFVFSGNQYNFEPEGKLSPGVYMLKVMSEGKMFTRKVTVR